jgi:hypothetical protein
MVVLGSGGGRLRVGTHHRSNGENATMVLVSLLRAAGNNIPELGLGSGRSTTGLSAIEV